MSWVWMQFTQSEVSRISLINKMEPQQEQPPVQALAEHKNHKFLWILVSVFILLTISGLLILKYQSDNHVSCIGVVTTAKNPQTGEIKTFGTPCEVPKGWAIVQEQLDETTNWKTYRNDEYGFEFKLPPRWINAEILPKTFISFVDNLDESEVLIKLKNEKSNYLEPVCNFYVYSNKNWDEFMSIDAGGKPTFINSKNGFTYGWGCGQDDYGYAGFDEYNTSIDENKLDLINSGKVRGPFQEFKNLIIPTFKFIEVATSSDISTWKTYKNEKYGFEFKYPRDWFLGESMNGMPTKIKHMSSENGFQIIYLFQFSNKNNLNSENFFKQMDKNRDIYTLINVDGTKVVQANQTTQNSRGVVTFIPLKSKVMLSVGVEESDSINDSYSDYIVVYNQILSTFKFIDQTATSSDISNWKTFISQYGFEIKYPKNWVAEEQIDSEPTGSHTQVSFGFYENNKLIPIFVVDVYPIGKYNIYMENLLGKNSEYAFVSPPNPGHSYFNYYKDIPADLRELSKLSLKTFKTASLPTYNTSTWKTYKNSKWKYEFKYPENTNVTSDQKSILQSQFTSPEDILLVSDKDGTFDLKILKGTLNIEKKSLALDRILSTFKVLNETTTNTSWEVYSDKELNVEFKYPSDWIIDTENYGKYRKINLHSSTYTYCWEDCGPDISFSLTNIENLDDYIAKNSDDEYSFSGLQKIKFQGYNAYEFSNTNTYEYFSILIEKDGKVYQFYFNSNSKKDFTELENQILSTFKFTK